MTNLTQATARELRQINPTEQNLTDTVDYLISLGWTFKPDRRIYPNGWWINSNHPTKCKPVGDSKNLHFGAWDTLKAYVASD